jgi:hypothetical protein
MIQIPAEAAAALVEIAGQVLRLDPADIESVVFSSSVDPIEVPSDDGGRRYEAGPQRIDITINMKPGARAAWIDKE